MCARGKMEPIVAAYILIMSTLRMDSLMPCQAPEKERFVKRVQDVAAREVTFFWGALPFNKRRRS